MYNYGNKTIIFEYGCKLNLFECHPSLVIWRIKYENKDIIKGCFIFAKASFTLEDERFLFNSKCSLAKHDENEMSERVNFIYLYLFIWFELCYVATVKLVEFFSTLVLPLKNVKNIKI